MLEDLYSLALQHEDPGHSHPVSVLRLMSAGRGGVDNSLKRLEEQGLVRRVKSDEWALTPEGIDRARQITTLGTVEVK